ncbi:MAG: helix-turn-helix transcriptional regulator [Verrucomicrobia bacterium]|nr:helix-turn-helix transcriptional regulator [Cytophagales bacterium]
MTIVSKNIKYLRRLNGLTQEQFARKIGIKRSLLGAYEEARANPNLDNLLNIAKVFGTDVDYILKNDIQKLKETKGIQPPTPHELFFPEETSTPKSLGNLINHLFETPDNELDTLFSQPKNDFSQVKNAEATFPNPVVLEPLSPAKKSINFPPTENTNSQFFDNQSNLLFKHKTPEKNLIVQPVPYVLQTEITDYLNSCVYPEYLKQLPLLHLPMLPSGNFRAFEAGIDFPVAQAVLVGQLVPNWYDLLDRQHYLIVVQKKGIFYRRIFNQVKFKGTLLLSSDNPEFPIAEVSIKEVLEAWEVKLIISNQVPDTGNSPVLDRLEKIADELQQEIRNLKS